MRDTKQEALCPFLTRIHGDTPAAGAGNGKSPKAPPFSRQPLLEARTVRLRLTTSRQGSGSESQSPGPFSGPACCPEASARRRTPESGSETPALPLILPAALRRPPEATDEFALLCTVKKMRGGGAIFKIFKKVSFCFVLQKRIPKIQMLLENRSFWLHGAASPPALGSGLALLVALVPEAASCHPASREPWLQTQDGLYTFSRRRMR